MRLRRFLALALILAWPVSLRAQPVLSAKEAPVRSPGKTGREAVLEAMKSRPQDPWPRGEGRVIVALPGSLDLQKAYHEPGGSFSPGLGTFGVSIWVVDASGNMRVTSDQVPMDQLRQKWIWRNEREIPGIQTDATNYQAYWHGPGNGLWILNLKRPAKESEAIVLAIRGVGPAGGPVYKLEWNGQRLLINQRWTITCDPPPVSVHLGHEGDAHWMTARSSVREWNGLDGWGYARLELGTQLESKLVIQDAAAVTTSLRFNRTRPLPVVTVPDPAFTACLEAQTAQLLMGSTGWEMRPGDPGYYPHFWLREASAAVVALSQAGYAETARQLAKPLAEIDFRSPTGPEADGPAVSLWALEEVAARLHDPQFDQWLWPHMRRKAELLWRMRQTLVPIRSREVMPGLGALAPRTGLDLVCEPAVNGLIRGRIGGEFPVLYVNAMAYRGLLAAAELATRLGFPFESGSWRGTAFEIRQAWEAAFRSLEADNDWTFIRGTWPSWIVAEPQEYRRLLEAHWHRHNSADDQPYETPRQAFRIISEAHQWLALERPTKAWNLFRWFTQHQSSPGLYTWGKGLSQDESYSRWDQVRGWLKPNQITPCYATAAEMLMLQMDMLAMLDESKAQPTLVIGAGIPSEWLKNPMSVKRLSTRLGMVDWVWQGYQMHLYLYGARYPVRLGPNFPTQTPIIVH